jgi:hypothetical protein
MMSVDACADVAKGGWPMELAINLGLGGAIVLVVGALVFGVIAQFVGETRTGYEWLVDAIAAGIGALIASEFIIGWQAFEPVFDGLGLVIEVVTRFMTGGTYTGHPMSV